MNQIKTDILKLFESKLEETKVAIEKIMIKETEKLKKAMETEFGKLHGRVEDVEKRVHALETRRNDRDYPFDPQSSIVIFHMKPQGETESTEQLKSAVNTMLTDGLELQNIQVLLVARTPSRDGKPGVVKCKLSSKDAKIHILSAK